MRKWVIANAVGPALKDNCIRSKRPDLRQYDLVAHQSHFIIVKSAWDGQVYRITTAVILETTRLRPQTILVDGDHQAIWVAGKRYFDPVGMMRINIDVCNSLYATCTKAENAKNGIVKIAKAVGAPWQTMVCSATRVVDDTASRQQLTS